MLSLLWREIVKHLAYVITGTVTRLCFIALRVCLMLELSLEEYWPRSG